MCYYFTNTNVICQVNLQIKIKKFSLVSCFSAALIMTQKSRQAHCGETFSKARFAAFIIIYYNVIPVEKSALGFIPCLAGMNFGKKLYAKRAGVFHFLFQKDGNLFLFVFVAFNNQFIVYLHNQLCAV